VLKNNYLIELDYDYNKNDLLDLYNRHDLVEYKHHVTGRRLGFSHCYTKDLFNEPVVQKIINDFSFLNLKFEFGEHCASAGFTLCESHMTPDCTIIPHIDKLRPACLTFPLTYPQMVQFYDGDEVAYEYSYSGAIIGNVGTIKHGVPYSPEVRRQFQLDVFNSWEELNEIF
jgi:hypothetical protein